MSLPLMENADRWGSPRDKLFDLIVPPGRLGFSLEQTAGGAVVNFIDSTSPLRDKIALGDLLAAVDHEEVATCNDAHRLIVAHKEGPDGCVLTIRRHGRVKDPWSWSAASTMQETKDAGCEGGSIVASVFL